MRLNRLSDNGDNMHSKGMFFLSCGGNGSSSRYTIIWATQHCQKKLFNANFLFNDKFPLLPIPALGLATLSLPELCVRLFFSLTRNPILASGLLTLTTLRLNAKERVRKEKTLLIFLSTYQKKMLIWSEQNCWHFSHAVTLVLVVFHISDIADTKVFGIAILSNLPEQRHVSWTIFVGLAVQLVSWLINEKIKSYCDLLGQSEGF